MKQQFLEAGEIVNTHGIKGEVKIVSWCDTPEIFCSFETIYVDEKPIKILCASAHKGNVICTLEGVEDVNAAMALKGKIVLVDRTMVPLPKGGHFIADLIGLEVRDADTCAVLGTLTDVLTPPAHRVYVVKGEQNYMIPAVDAFIRETNVEGGYLLVKLIEGLNV